MLLVFNFANWCPTLFPYQKIFVSLNSNMTDITSKAGTVCPDGTPDFILIVLCGIRVAQSLVFCVEFCGSLFVWFLVLLVPTDGL